MEKAKRIGVGSKGRRVEHKRGRGDAIMEKANGRRVGSKGRRLHNKSGWGGAGGRAQRLPPQCVPSKTHVENSLHQEKQVQFK